MPINKSDIKFYLTSVEPNLEQTSYSQSIGGYAGYVKADPSKSLVCPRTSLTAEASRSDATLTMTRTPDFVGLNYFGINGEVIDVEPFLASSGVGIAVVDQRSVNRRRKMHASGSIVHGLDFGSLFNDNFNKDFKQYRCLALKNTSDTDTAYGVKIFFRQNSRNIGNVFKVALEIPTNDQRNGSVATGSTRTTIIDSDLSASLFANNHFTSAMMRFLTGINSGQTRVILSFDSSTRTYVLDSALPSNPATTDTFEIEPGPCQRLSSGLIKPNLSFRATTPKTSLDINIDGTRANGSNLQPNDVVYVWLERALGRKSSAMQNNSIVLTMNYKTSP
ncbi:MAG: hypothetical protein HC888_01355 [Candidatus Competibacteraceae bacterium]|nr:hypothetical protein [Candidatus Competibacteraceae bacterium]